MICDLFPKKLLFSIHSPPHMAGEELNQLTEYFLRRADFELQRREYHELNRVTGLSNNIYCLAHVHPTIVFCNVIDCKGSILNCSFVFRQRTKGF